jgi:hypothetical protein
VNPELEEDQSVSELGVHGEELLGVSPLPRLRRAVRAGDRGLRGEALQEGAEASSGDLLGAPDPGGEVDPVEALEVGLEQIPETD